MTRGSTYRLGVFRSEKRWDSQKSTSPSVLRVCEAEYPVGHFRAQHGLSPSQAWVANQLLAEKQREHRLTGFRYAMRIGGIVSAIKRGLTGNSAWGRSMLASRGGQVLARYAPAHLHRISGRGVLKRQANAEMRRKYGRRYG